MASSRFESRFRSKEETVFTRFAHVLSRAHRVRDVLHVERRLDKQAVLEGAIGVEGAIRLLRTRLMGGHEFGLGVSWVGVSVLLVRCSRRDESEKDMVSFYLCQSACK